MQAFHFDTVASTNEEAKRLLGRGEIAGVAYVMAREQTAGKGSRGRHWVSPRDAGLYLSLVQRFGEGLDPSALSVESFTLAAGVACAEVLHEHFGLDVTLKPINDLYVGSAKLGGILVESIVERDQIRALVTGVGLNLRDVARALPADASRAISIEEIIEPDHAHSFSAIPLAPILAKSVVRWNEVVIAGGSSEVLAAWERWKKPGCPTPAL